VRNKTGKEEKKRFGRNREKKTEQEEDNKIESADLPRIQTTAVNCPNADIQPQFILHRLSSGGTS
jgi:hypothetical protein